MVKYNIQQAETIPSQPQQAIIIKKTKEPEPIIKTEPQETIEPQKPKFVSTNPYLIEEDYEDKSAIFKDWINN